MEQMLLGASPAELRKRIRSGEFSGPTGGLARGHVQANLVVLPRAWAFDFLLFCQRNPKPCPILEVTNPGQYMPLATAKDADLRTDLPRYRIFRNGELEAEVTDVTHYWTDDAVAFLLGCSFTFEAALLAAGIRPWELAAGQNPPIYISNIPTVPAGLFSGRMVVSMLPIPAGQVARAAQVSARFPRAHGGPVHIGRPKAIGIQDLMCPDFGEPFVLKADEVPVFWACGVTPQIAISQARPEWAITHAPGYMFIADMKDSELEE